MTKTSTRTGGLCHLWHQTRRHPVRRSVKEGRALCKVYIASLCNVVRERHHIGELDQLADRPLSMREVPGSKPGFSISFIALTLHIILLH